MNAVQSTFAKTSRALAAISAIGVATALSLAALDSSVVGTSGIASERALITRSIRSPRGE